MSVNVPPTSTPTSFIDCLLESTDVRGYLVGPVKKFSQPKYLTLTDVVASRLAECREALEQTTNNFSLS
jgi:hypothetical protein